MSRKQFSGRRYTESETGENPGFPVRMAYIVKSPTVERSNTSLPKLENVRHGDCRQTTKLISSTALIWSRQRRTETRPPTRPRAQPRSTDHERVSPARHRGRACPSALRCVPSTIASRVVHSLQPLWVTPPFVRNIATHAQALAQNVRYTCVHTVHTHTHTHTRETRARIYTHTHMLAPLFST